MFAVRSLSSITKLSVFMTMTVNSGSNGAYNFVPFSMPSKSQLSKNVAVVAIPALALLMLYNIPVVSAQKQNFAECYKNCISGKQGVLKNVFCATLCALNIVSYNKNF